MPVQEGARQALMIRSATLIPVEDCSAEKRLLTIMATPHLLQSSLTTEVSFCAVAAMKLC